MSSNNLLPFPVQENADQIQALGMPISSTTTTTEYPFAYINPYNGMRSPPPFHGPFRRSNPAIYKIRQQIRPPWMYAARRFVDIGEHQARSAPIRPNRVMVINRQEVTVMNHHQVFPAAAAFTPFQERSTLNLLQGADCNIRINGDEVGKLLGIEEEEDGLDLTLKL